MTYLDGVGQRNNSGSLGKFAAIGGWTVPMWVSWIAFVVAGGLSYFGLRHLTQRR